LVVEPGERSEPVSRPRSPLLVEPGERSEPVSRPRPGGNPQAETRAVDAGDNCSDHRPMIGYCYMLECADGSYYVGSTTDLEARLFQHQSAMGALYTKSRLPVRLVWYEKFDRITDAFNREKQIQNWSRAKRQALIEQRYDALPDLAERYAKKRRRAAQAGDGGPPT
jgi:putative endonuclease